MAEILESFRHGKGNREGRGRMSLCPSFDFRFKLFRNFALQRKVFGLLKNRIENSIHKWKITRHSLFSISRARLLHLHTLLNTRNVIKGEEGMHNGNENEVSLVFLKKPIFLNLLASFSRSG